VRVPPPRKFRPLLGEVRSARILPGVSTVGGTGELSYAKRFGLRYESKVHDELKGKFGRWFMAGPVIEFFDGNSKYDKRFCVPDGLIRHHTRMVVCEIKSQHMPEAWWQLRKLYEPVVRKLWGRELVLLEICRSYDPQMPFPEKVEFVEDIGKFALEAKDGTLGVLQWKL